MRSAPCWATGLVGLVSWLVPGSAVHAQAELLAPGREARIFVRGVAGAFEGTLLGVNAQSVTLALQNGSAFTLQAAQIQRSEVLGSASNARLGALLGAGLGAGVGVWLAVASRDDCLAAGGFCPDPEDHFDEWKLVVPTLAGAAAGAVAGRFIRSPRWVPGFLPGGSGNGDGTFGLVWTLPLPSGLLGA